MMIEGLATVYGPAPTWNEVDVVLRACKFGLPRQFLVGRSLPGNSRAGIAPEHRLAVAWLQTDKRWTHDEGGQQPLGWVPLYLALAPSYPPWPPSDHPDVVAIQAK